MTGQLPESGKSALQQLAGPRYRTSAYPLLDLAKTAVLGHVMIAEKVREHAAKAVADREAARAASGARTGAGGAGPA